jgi:hypothetical protein
VWALNKTRSSFKGSGRAAMITSGITKCYLCNHTMSYNIKGKYRYIVCSNRRVNGCANKKLTVYSGIEAILLNELVDILDNHSPLVEDLNVMELKASLAESEAEIIRLTDAIRYRGFDSSLGELLDGLERNRDTIKARLGETSQRPSKGFLESVIADLKASILDGDTIPEINQNMRLVFKSLVIDDEKKVIDLTFVDGSRAFIALSV